MFEYDLVTTWSVSWGDGVCRDESRSLRWTWDEEVAESGEGEWSMRAGSSLEEGTGAIICGVCMSKGGCGSSLRICFRDIVCDDGRGEEQTWFTLVFGCLWA